MPNESDATREHLQELRRVQLEAGTRIHNLECELKAVRGLVESLTLRVLALEKRACWGGGK